MLVLFLACPGCHPYYDYPRFPIHIPHTTLLHASQVEKKVEKIRQVCHITSKKLNACMQSSGPDVERRLVYFGTCVICIIISFQFLFIPS